MLNAKDNWYFLSVISLILDIENAELKRNCNEKKEKNRE